MKNYQTLGALLRKNRINAKLSIHQVAYATKIQAEMILFIENEEWNQMPSFAYTSRFIRIYAKYLGVEYRPYIEDIKKDIQKIQKKQIQKYQRKNNLIAIFSVMLMIVSVVVIIFTVKNSIESENKRQKIVATKDVTQKINKLNDQVNNQNIEKKILAPKKLKENEQKKLTQQKINTQKLPQKFIVNNIDIASINQYQNDIAKINDDTPNIGVFIKAIDEVWVRVEKSNGEIIFSDTLKIGQVIQIPDDKLKILLTTDNLGKIIFKKNGEIIPKVTEKKEIVIETDINEII